MENLSAILLQTSVQCDNYRVQAENLERELRNSEAFALQVSVDFGNLKDENIKLEEKLKEKNDKIQFLVKQKEELDLTLVNTTASCVQNENKSKKLENELELKNVQFHELSDRFTKLEVKKTFYSNYFFIS